MNFRDKFNIYKDEFEKYLIGYIENLSGVHSVLMDSVKYSLLSGGKRVRPILMMAFCDLLGGNMDDIYPFAVALEMIHTYSLIHDDLPCMDNDTIRRGKPCNHVKYGEDIALLAGDGLLTQSFEMLSGMPVKEDMSMNVLRSISILANCAGMCGMVSGQCYDLRMDMSDISGEQVIELYRLKTARLFYAACSIGALMGGANEMEIKLAGVYGEKSGIAFQLVDDILDNEQKLLSAFVNETPQEVLIKLINEAKKSVKSIKGDSEFLINFTDYLTNRNH